MKINYSDPNDTNINKIELTTYLFITTLVALGMLWAFNDPALFNSYIREDGPIEWLTVVGLLLGMMLCFFRTAKLHTGKMTPFITMTFLFGLGYLFAAGEEISWGQRIFNIESPEWFERHNLQRETNLHNLNVMGVNLNKFLFSTIITVLFCIYFFVVTPLYICNNTFFRQVDKLAIPIPKIHHIGAFVLLAATLHIPDTGLRVSELFEFGSVFITILIFSFPLNQTIFCFTKSKD